MFFNVDNVIYFHNSRVLCIRLLVNRTSQKGGSLGLSKPQRNELRNIFSFSAVSSAPFFVSASVDALVG